MATEAQKPWEAGYYQLCDLGQVTAGLESQFLSLYWWDQTDDDFQGHIDTQNSGNRSEDHVVASWVSIWMP